MADPTTRSQPSAGPSARLAWPLGLWLLGLVASFWPTWLSGFARVQGGLGDSRLVNFTLEHSYRWLVGLPLARDLFSPPIYYPVEHVAFYTDLLLGVAPLYWPWRWLGAGPHTAYQLWMLACFSLNFFAAYILMRRGLGCSRLAGAAGAYLFAYAGPRLVNVVHQQLNPQFFLAFALIAGWLLIRELDGAPTPARIAALTAMLCGGLLLQLATAVYPLVFFTIGASAALGLALVLRETRRKLAALLRRRWPFLLAGGLCTMALAGPLLLGYWLTASELGLRPYSVDRLPRLLSWLLPGSFNLLYGGLHRLPGLAWAAMPPHQNGLGVVTPLLAVIGLWLGRRQRPVQLVVVATTVLFLVTLRLPGDWSLWRWVRELVPGAAALRAVPRVAIMALYPAALGLTLTAERLARRSPWILLPLLAVVALEQVHRPFAFDKSAARARVSRIAASVPAGAEAFLLVGRGQGRDHHIHDDAAWAALSSGVPTVNGRYGKQPRFWRLADLAVDGPEDLERIRDNLEFWCRKRGLDPGRVAWVEMEAVPGTPQLAATDQE
jgi:hypothetical protein